MELLSKSAATALIVSVLGLLLKKRNPEWTLMLGALAAAGILIASAGMLDGFRQLRDALRGLTDSGELLVEPVLKCLAISLITRFSVELCRDSAQNSSAAAVELAGSVCALSVVMPLLISVLKMIGGLL